MTSLFEQQYIAGSWRAPASGRYTDVVNPATLEAFARTPDGDIRDTQAAIAAAHEAFAAWSQTALSERIALMEKMLAIFRTHREVIIDLEARELGAPVSFGAYAHCDFQFVRIADYIEKAAQVPLSTPYPAATVVREPVGVVACITPWNYPLGQVVQKIVPALLMGNTVVLKPSPQAPLTTTLLIDAFDRAGFPPGVINLVCGGKEVGEVLSRHPWVDMVSFTGSTEVGIAIGQAAMLTVKRLCLELGGKSPYVFLKSPDYRAAYPKLLSSILLNSGQTCTSLSRLVVPREDEAAIEEYLVKAFAEFPVGDPLDPKTRIGPVSSVRQYKRVREYIRIGVQEGARLVCGEVPAAEPAHGCFIKPVIFGGVKNSMRIAQEEIFGPVLCVIPYDTAEEALSIANDTRYGLSSAVFGPHEQALDFAHRIRSGNVYVNGASKDMTAPFGGVKQSGFGRESGVAGLEEFTQLKSIFVQDGPGKP